MSEQLDLGLGAAAPVEGEPGRGRAGAVAGSETEGATAGAAAGNEPRSAPPAAGRGPGGPPPPSDEQRAVLEFRTDLVVTAAAGSGKTRTLVDLYAALLGGPGRVGPEPLRPGEILCLTFTERAAREIQARVRDRIADPALLRELEAAPIGTFHGWCAGLLRDHPLEAGIDPRFAVLAEEAADDLLRGAAVETLRRGLETGDEPARIAVEILGLGEAAARLAELVRDVRTAGWSDRDVISRFEARLEEVAAEAAGPLAGEVDAAAGDLVGLVVGTLTTPKAIGYLRDFERALGAWRAARTDDSAAGLDAAARAPSHSWKGVKEERHAVLAAIERWSAARLELAHALQLGAWPALVVSVRAASRAARAARAALDYDDLLLRSRELLAGHAGVIEPVRARHRVILVDEHQDTDPVQDAILRLLLG
ncbi:MAG TPA: UvrD-helicase domain-containing protein, partial [Gemmatimonadota bacterium]|nr:UvrD-helicase domain-containing protein [Gemmatimonadota bacterium]